MSETGREYWEGAVVLTPEAQRRHSIAAISQPYESSHCALTLFVYCHNHESTILHTLATLTEALDVVEQRFEIVLIDDHSQDSSAELVRGFMLAFPRISMVLRVNKQHKGLAANFTDAAFIGCGKYFRLVQGDTAEPVETLVDVLRAVGDADIVVPYYVNQSGSGWSRLYAWLLNAIGGHSINHFGAAHVHLRYNVMRWQAHTQGPDFQIDLLCRLLEKGFTLKQVPCRADAVTQRKEHAGRRFLSAAHVLIDQLLRRFT